MSIRKLTSLSFGLVTKTFEHSRAARLKLPFWIENRPTEVRTILLVDDQAELLKNMAGKIEMKLGVGPACIDPESPCPIKEQVLAAVAAAAPDLIIMDGNLGTGTTGEKLTGTEIIKELRGLGYRGYILANSNDPIMNWEMMDYGADFNARDKYTRYDKIKQLALFINKYFQRGQQ
ncbi:MAG: hypothetical protein WCW67_02565 [Candidatus Margulisiibacteriota bacterium]|jgi:CheY-like chemotaxis protein